MAALSKSQRDQLVKKLNEAYRTLVAEIREELDNTGNQHRIDLLNREPGDSGDESLAVALADLNITRFDRHVQALGDIEAALQRVKDGEYGVCTDCGDDIGFARLEAYPTAKRCIVCQEQREKHYAHEAHPKM
jgi:RNA polymerase-binding protein DksA